MDKEIVEGDNVKFYDCDRADKDRNYSGEEKYYSIGKVLRIRITQPLHLPVSDIYLPGGETVVDIELPDGRISNGHFITGIIKINNHERNKRLSAFVFGMRVRFNR